VSQGDAMSHGEDKPHGDGIAEKCLEQVQFAPREDVLVGAMLHRAGIVLGDEFVVVLPRSCLDREDVVPGTMEVHEEVKEVVAEFGDGWMAYRVDWGERAFGM